MASVIIQEETTKNPVSLIGKEAGVCWDKDISNKSRNYKRGIACLKSGHGRTWEYPQVYMVIDGYSARVIRELYTHIAGGPTRLQASARRIDYSDFKFVVPESISKNEHTNQIYVDLMEKIACTCKQLEGAFDIPREDAAMLLPLGMETKVVLRTNLRNLIDMSHQRLCSKAFWEFRQLMEDMAEALSKYSDEWAYVVGNYFEPKCEFLGYCPEKVSCGRMNERGAKKDG